MKKLLYISAIGIFCSCTESGEIQLQNKINQVKITDVKWGNFYLAEELLPGESTDKIKVVEDDNLKFPVSSKVSFKMTANQKTIYLETDAEFTLKDGDFLQIVLDDNTKVSNPNKK